MINNVLRMILRRLSACLGIMKEHLSHSGKIDLSDIFPPGIEDIIMSGSYEKRFRMCKSDDEYNKEVTDFFKYHWDSFYLDQKKRDGHFRA